MGEGGAVGVMGVGVALPEETNQHRRAGTGVDRPTHRRGGTHLVRHRISTGGTHLVRHPPTGEEAPE